MVAMSPNLHCYFMVSYRVPYTCYAAVNPENTFSSISITRKTTLNSVKTQDSLLSFDRDNSTPSVFLWRYILELTPYLALVYGKFLYHHNTEYYIQLYHVGMKNQKASRILDSRLGQKESEINTMKIFVHIISIRFPLSSALNIDFNLCEYQFWRLTTQRRNNLSWWLLHWIVTKATTWPCQLHMHNIEAINVSWGD